MKSIRKIIFSYLKEVLPEKYWLLAKKSKRYVTRNMAIKVDCKQIHRHLLDAGISLGDTLYVYSSLSRIGNVANGASDVINALRDAVGPEGTLGFPCHLPPQHVFDLYRNGDLIDLRFISPHTGVIPNFVSKLNDVYLSSHPFASTCAVGKNAAYLTQGHDNDPRVCHKESPLSKLLSLDGKLVGLGTDFAAIAFYHVIEDIEPSFPIEVYLPQEEIEYIDFNGIHVKRKINRYDPAISFSRIERPGGQFIRKLLLEYFKKNKIIKEVRVGGAQAWIMSARSLHKELKKLLNLNITIYTTEIEYKKLGIDILN